MGELEKWVKRLDGKLLVVIDYEEGSAYVEGMLRLEVSSESVLVGTE